jgi:lysozyme
MSPLTLAFAAVGAYLVWGKFSTTNGRGIDAPQDGGTTVDLITQATNVFSGLVNGNMVYDTSGLQLTENSESCSLTAYWDVTGGVWTIGWGHTGPDVYQGQVIDQPTADALLMSDIAGAVATVNRLVSVQLTQGQFDALVDFVYNVGSGNFESSTLLADVNAGNFGDVGYQLSRWNHSGGQVLAGLTNRRANEATEFYS